MDQLHSAGFGHTPAVAGAQLRNRTLRNTYALLALSLLPTIAGAMIGVSTGFSLFAGSSPLFGLFAFIAVSMAFFFAIERLKNSAAGVFVLLGFTFFMGLMLSRLLGFVLHFSNGVELIALAFGGTAVIFAGMATIATVSKRSFSSLGNWLTVGLLLLIVASVANIWLQLPALMLTVSMLAVVIFSLFIVFDVQRIVNGGETNYILATLSIYLDLYNLFSNLLALLSVFAGRRD